MPSSKPRVEVFSQRASRYDLWYEKNRLTYLSELKLLASLSSFPSPSLEVGVGTGRFAQPLKINFGLDPSLPMLKIAKKRGIRVVQGLGESLPFASDSMASCLLSITLCFLESPRRTLGEIHRVLYPGGEVVVAFIDKDSSWGTFYREKDSPFYKVARFYSFDEVKSMLEGVGFVLEKVKQTLFRHPLEEETLELPQEGRGRGSFVGVLARKKY